MNITVKPMSKDEMHQQGIDQWPTWGAPVSEFDWTYDSEEHAYVLEGVVSVITDQGDVDIKAGDYVVFPKGLSCRWKVIEPIRKHYLFK